MIGVSRLWCFGRPAVAAAIVALGATLLAGCGKADAPEDLDLSTSKATEQGLYLVSVEPQVAEIPVGSIHNWTVRVTTPSGEAVEQAIITVDGDMPEHGHGLPTQPQVTQELGDGRYLVEGMKFNMPGWWTLTYGIEGAAGSDTVTFNLVL